MIPGSNVLNMAMRVISAQTISYYQFVSRGTNAIGDWVSVYASPVTITGSFQPVPKSIYEQYGLDFDKTYYQFYVSKNILDVSRGVSGDKIAFNGDEFSCQSLTPWFQMDGWNCILCVLINGTQP